MRDGRSVPAYALQIRADSASWIDRETGAVESVPTDDLRLISFRRPERKRHPVRTMALGTLMGTALGASVGLAAEPNFVFGQRDLVVLGALDGAFLGLGIGGLIASDPLRPERFAVALADSTAAR